MWFGLMKLQTSEGFIHRWVAVVFLFGTKFYSTQKQFALSLIYSTYTYTYVYTIYTHTVYTFLYVTVHTLVSVRYVMLHFHVYPYRLHFRELSHLFMSEAVSLAIRLSFMLIYVLLTDPPWRQRCFVHSEITYWFHVKLQLGGK